MCTHKNTMSFYIPNNKKNVIKTNNKCPLLARLPTAHTHTHSKLIDYNEKKYVLYLNSERTRRRNDIIVLFDDRK